MANASLGGAQSMISDGYMANLLTVFETDSASNRNVSDGNVSEGSVSSGSSTTVGLHTSSTSDGTDSGNILEGLFRSSSADDGAAPLGLLSHVLAEQEELDESRLDLVQPHEVTSVLGWIPPTAWPILDNFGLEPRDESVIYKQRGQIFRCRANEWKERGTGDVMLLSHKETGRTRFLMWQDRTFKTIANFNVIESLSHCCLRPCEEDPKTWEWRCQDCSDDCAHDEQFALHFETEQHAAAFKQAFDDAKMRSNGSFTSNANAPAGSSAMMPQTIEPLLEGGDEREPASRHPPADQRETGSSVNTTAAEDKNETLAKNVEGLQL